MPNSKERQVEIGDRYVALYHVVYSHESFEEAAQALHAIVRDAQAKCPNQRRALFLDIEGHRNEQGGFDSDMLELQEHFLVGFLGQFLSEIHCPLADMTRDSGQNNDIPDRLDIHAPAGEPGT
jgi:hypothetical protein